MHISALPIQKLFSRHLMPALNGLYVQGELSRWWSQNDQLVGVKSAAHSIDDGLGTGWGSRRLLAIVLVKESRDDSIGGYIKHGGGESNHVVQFSNSPGDISRVR